MKPREVKELAQTSEPVGGRVRIGIKVYLIIELELFNTKRGLFHQSGEYATSRGPGQASQAWSLLGTPVQVTPATGLRAGAAHHWSAMEGFCSVGVGLKA